MCSTHPAQPHVVAALLQVQGLQKFLHSLKRRTHIYTLTKKHTHTRTGLDTTHYYYTRAFYPSSLTTPSGTLQSQGSLPSSSLPEGAETTA